MTPFEEELRKALKRRTPSEDFTARLFDKIEQQKRWSWAGAWAGWRMQWAAAVMALVLVLAGAGLGYRQHLRVERGEEAKKQLLVAMRIASTQLRAAQARVKEIERPETVMQ